jgi:hypothetical protein
VGEHVEGSGVLLASRTAEGVGGGANGDVGETGGIEELAPAVDGLPSGDAPGPQVDRTDGLIGQRAAGTTSTNPGHPFNAIAPQIRHLVDQALAN